MCLWHTVHPLMINWPVEKHNHETCLLGGITMRVNVILECTETGDRNYITTKNKRNNPERIEFKKYSPRLNKVTLHRETK